MFWIFNLLLLIAVKILFLNFSQIKNRTPVRTSHNSDRETDCFMVKKIYLLYILCNYHHLHGNDLSQVRNNKNIFVNIIFRTLQF